jgi:hypothetical protein
MGEFSDETRNQLTSIMNQLTSIMNILIESSDNDDLIPIYNRLERNCHELSCIMYV